MSASRRAAYLASQHLTQHWLVASATDLALLREGIVSGQLRAQAIDALAPAVAEGADEHAKRIGDTCTCTGTTEAVSKEATND